MTPGPILFAAISALIAGPVLAGPVLAGPAVAGPVAAPGPVVDPSTAVVLPVEDVAGKVESLIFAEASADGAVVDRGGREFILASDVLFAFDRATLTPRARKEIARIAGVLKSSDPISGVAIAGYTDSAGSDRYNLGLSRRRASAVRAELVTGLGSGVPVTSVGRGERDPVASNATRRGRAANRRVEIRVR